MQFCNSVVSKRLKNSTNLKISVHIFNSKAGLTKVRKLGQTAVIYELQLELTNQGWETYYAHVLLHIMYICMQYTERNSLNKNRIYSFTRHRQHLCGHNIVLWTLLFTINTVLVPLGTLHRLLMLSQNLRFLTELPFCLDSVQL